MKELCSLKIAMSHYQLSKSGLSEVKQCIPPLSYFKHQVTQLLLEK